MIKDKTIENKIELIFKLSYFALVLFSFNSFCARHAYITYLSYAIAVFGGLIIVSRLSHLKDYKNVRIWLLCAFVVSYVISSINTIQYGILENVQALVWMSIQFFAVFAFDRTIEKEDVIKEFKALSVFFLIYTFFMAVISLLMMIKGYSQKTIVDEYYLVYSGFLYNRLWGCYTDPNYGSVFSILSILISCYYLNKSKPVIKVLLIVNIIAEYFYFSYSDSRTGQLAILLSVIVLVFELLMKKVTKSKKALIKTIAFVILAVIIAFAFWYGTRLVQGVTSDIKVSSAIEAAVEQGATTDEAEEIADIDRVGRAFYSGNISNNRFAIWEYGLTLFKQNPIIGISFRNIMEYSRDNMPQGYLGFASMHNFIVDILVSQGVLGILIVFSFFVIVPIQILKRMSKLDSEDYRLFAYSISCIVAITVSMLTYSETFYMNTGGAFMFWYLLGLITNYLLVDKPETKEN